MARKVIEVDNAPNIRLAMATAFDDVDDNFTELYAGAGSSSVDARHYGIHTSTTDDQTVNFQTMMDDVNYSGGTIVLPYGEIHIDGDIDVDNGLAFGWWPPYTELTGGVGGPTLRGQGMFGTTIVQEGTGGTIRVFESGSATGRQHNGITFENFSIIGPGLTDDTNIGIQLGGVSAAASDIIEGSKLSQVRIQNFATCLAMDDCTSTFLERVLCEGFNYGIEFGFNCDNVKILQCRFGSAAIGPASAAMTATTTSGDATVTTTGGYVTTNLRAGMRINSGNFAYGTTILSITDSTHFEASANASATSSTSIYFSQGIALSFGRGPFLGAWPSASTGNANGINIESTWFMRCAEALGIDDNTTANVKFDTAYFERCNRIATIDGGASTTSANHIMWDNCHFSQSDVAFKDFAIYENGAAGTVGNFGIRNCRSDQNSPVPWVRLRSASGVLDWDNNTMGVSTGSRINIFDSSIAFNPSNGTKFTYGIRGANKEPVTLGVTGSLTPLIPSKVDCIIKIGAITGNITVANASVTYASEGQRLRFIFLEDGTAGHTVAFGTIYHLSTAWTDSVVTTDASKRTYIEFEYTGAAFIQVSAANVWTA